MLHVIKVWFRHRIPKPKGHLERGCFDPALTCVEMVRSGNVMIDPDSRIQQNWKRECLMLTTNANAASWVPSVTKRQARQLAREFG